MRMLVMSVRVMRVCVVQGFMSVAMGVRLLAVPGGFVSLLMMGIM